MQGNIHRISHNAHVTHPTHHAPLAPFCLNFNPRSTKSPLCFCILYRLDPFYGCVDSSSQGTLDLNSFYFLVQLKLACMLTQIQIFIAHLSYIYIMILIEANNIQTTFFYELVMTTF